MQGEVNIHKKALKKLERKLGKKVNIDQLERTAEKSSFAESPSTSSASTSSLPILQNYGNVNGGAGSSCGNEPMDVSVQTQKHVQEYLDNMERELEENIEKGMQTQEELEDYLEFLGLDLSDDDD